MAIKGGALRLVMIAAYFVAFCCASIITGAFAWFTATQFGTRNIATLALAAITMLYTLTCMIITCCTAGISFFAVASLIFDFIFLCAMIAVAALNGSGRHGCDRGSNNAWPRVVYRGSGISGCRLFVASFAVAIIAIFMFVVTIVTQSIIRRRGNRSRTYVSKA
ncbi:uncharacterized protein MYCFIDRAFT_88196 [Pseudocercospora fijiensis CIRAD86]|uniref:MARVEL domain-containing protein n=1 Tax=Pseudocercospora fijiensis (strain CIRAD86) TaxID=383855 RepID=M2Z0E0_PSEFD|nr:uncharacterized protein MYCFIDRAFT_88196 [Pseudocercospora fijiensis CIRAD86]EME83290.1 hypothetical protein MYCFIDRAFT_88196 [Pseudocercospora fijiensis CIRAD86]